MRNLIISLKMWWWKGTIITGGMGKCDDSRFWIVKKITAMIKWPTPTECEWEKMARKPFQVWLKNLKRRIK